MIKVFAWLAALSAWAGAPPAEPPKDEPRMEWHGAQCLVEMPSDEIITSPREWKKLWKQRIGQPPPEVDLKKNFAVVVFLGERMTAGYSVVFVPAAEGKAMLLIRYGEKTPLGMVAQMLTRPWAIKLFPKVRKKEILVEYDPR